MIEIATMKNSPDRSGMVAQCWLVGAIPCGCPKLARHHKNG